MDDTERSPGDQEGLQSQREDAAPTTTIHDVAARAGVSIATVSRVLNDSRPVRPEHRMRVLAAADELGYSANLLGRALRQGRSHSIGLVVPDLENPFFATLAQDVSRAFASSQIDVYVYSADNDLETERRAIASFLGRRVDGLVLIPCDEVRSAPSVRLASRAVVTIQLDRLAPSVRTHFIGCDNRYGMAQIASHVRAVVEVDPRPIVFIGAHPTSSSAHERLDTFAKAFPAARLVLGSFDFSFGRDAMSQLIDEGLKAAVVVTDADVIALGVIAAVHAHGRAIPRDYRVTGFDGVGVTFLAQPPLTTVRQPVGQMTAAIVDIVRGAFDGGGTRDYVVRRFRPSLIVRESSPA
ncbi:MAG: LacI family DNA-binding transcriptional regulator [Chloroflexi bacterium]|nr:LacI family DNA-binding transcriptional regulator [Chloroflexota bacterium]